MEMRTYDEVMSAKYAFSFAINGIVFGNVACALAKWENVTGPADPMMSIGEGKRGCVVVNKVECGRDVLW